MGKEAPFEDQDPLDMHMIMALLFQSLLHSEVYKSPVEKSYSSSEIPVRGNLMEIGSYRQCCIVL